VLGRNVDLREKSDQEDAKNYIIREFMTCPIHQIMLLIYLLHDAGYYLKN
jgi:hypothetical protein